LKNNSKDEIYNVYFIVFSFQIMAQSDFEKAEKLYKQDKFDQAKVLFESYLKTNANNYKTIEYLGDIAGHQKSGMKPSSNIKF